ncbi:MAG: polysaccharide biosynthesis/export family protein [Paracoccaceae bacterium]
MKPIVLSFAVLTLSACGATYHSPSVNPLSGTDSKVRVIAMSSETILAANRSDFQPKTLPGVFFQTAGSSGAVRGAGALPSPSFNPGARPNALKMRLPSKPEPKPYLIGVGDVILIATPQIGSTVEQLTGLLAASNSRQGYTVQDDGAIAVPNVGRIPVAKMTLEEVEDMLFQRLVANQIDPTFSLEIAEFNSKKVSVGGAVGKPTIIPIKLRPVHLDEALAAAGGIDVLDQELASVRLYRDGQLYQIPLSELYSDKGLAKLTLMDGDSVFVDTAYHLDQAQTYFEQQIASAQIRQSARQTALNELRTEVEIRRNAQNDARANYLARLDLNAVDQDFVYLTGEVKTQARFPLPFGQRATLADALYGAAGGVPTRTGNVREIYVLRASPDPRDFGAVTAWQLDGRQATNLTLATRFELRPNDVIFVAEQPVTRWNRVISQITPSLISLGANAITD